MHLDCPTSCDVTGERAPITHDLVPVFACSAHQLRGSASCAGNQVTGFCQFSYFNILVAAVSLMSAYLMIEVFELVTVTVARGDASV
jgi:uncharacterized membrane protein (GlpM family)